MDEETFSLFRAEAESLAESLEERLLALRDAPQNKALIDGVFRDLHTLKGTGAMFGRTDIAGFLHDFETAFEAVRSGSVTVDAELISISLAARDHVASLLDGGDAAEGAALLARLQQHLGPVAAPAPASPEAGGSDWHIRFTLAADTLALGGKPALVLAELARIGARDIRLPDGTAWDADSEAQAAELSWEAEIDGDTTEADIEGAFLFYDDGLEMVLTRLDGTDTEAAAPDAQSDAPHEAATDLPATPVPGQPDMTAPRATNFMRVPAERLDDMMDRVGELVIAEARLIEIAARSGEPGLVQVAEDIQRLATAMRDTAMSIRMTPIGSITGRFKRLVHDLTMATGKPIEFITEGEETELDKTVIERLSDPLMHILRNAADHGLESAERRRAMGKPEKGQLRLSARYSGAEVLISLSDDGRGLDRDAIRNRAIDRGLLAEGVEITDEALHQMIFEPGFSTAAAVTELSGRGVGMDVVRRTIDELRGAIEVESEPGFGTTVTLRLPLTLAIIDGLLIEVAGERFVLPMAAVEEIVELPETLAQEGKGNAFLDIRDRLVPFLRLRPLLNCRGEQTPYQKVIVVTSVEGRVGLVVDRIIGTNQTVIKQLSPLHSALKTFSGATILGDGSVALILDVPHLVAQGIAQPGKEAA
ncbi:chemotaxis protein CheA [Pararhodobacter sp. CCB-MM2]|uniref:chemotaxis protein CheA n=1 Tax=Pararhodobacter sp. CCB-MM2 TaxID=1786003 RepID=UPI000AF75B85|nr:chemotaxis protein CheA [Pararhodobacter sp. CCB-MM2]